MASTAAIKFLFAWFMDHEKVFLAFPLQIHGIFIKLCHYTGLHVFNLADVFLVSRGTWRLWWNVMQIRIFIGISIFSWSGMCGQNIILWLELFVIVNWEFGWQSADSVLSSTRRVHSLSREFSSYGLLASSLPSFYPFHPTSIYQWSPYHTGIFSWINYLLTRLVEFVSPLRNQCDSCARGLTHSKVVMVTFAFAYWLFSSN